MRNKYIVVFLALAFMMIGCNSQSNKGTHNPAELSEQQEKLLSDAIVNSYYEISYFYCNEGTSDFLKNNNVKACDFKEGANYYVADPIMYYHADNSSGSIVFKEITERTYFSVLRENEVLFHLEAYDYDNGNWAYFDENESMLTKLYEGEENFLFLSYEGNCWIVTDSDALLFSQGLGSPDTIDDEVLKQVRKEILEKKSYSFYKHSIDFQALDEEFGMN